MKTFPNILLFIFGGFLAGFVSLLFLASVPSLVSINNIVQIIFNSTAEEFVKLFILGFILKNIRNFSFSFREIFSSGVIYGLGFTLFEVFLRNLNKTILIPREILLVLFIHITTSILLILANHLFLTKGKSKKLSTNPLLYLILAIFIHLCYNLTVQMMF